MQYYADMGVGGIHLYAAVADFILSPQGGGYMQMPGSYRALSIDSHRLLNWKVFHPSPWSLHYYGQVRTACQNPIFASSCVAYPPSFKLHFGRWWSGKQHVHFLVVMLMPEQDRMQVRKDHAMG